METTTPVPELAEPDAKRGSLVLARQFVRFNLVGVLNTAAAYAGYSLLLVVGSHRLLALAAHYLCGMGVSYALNRKFTFGAARRPKAAGFLRLVLLYLPIFGINAVLLSVLVETFRVGEFAAQAVSLLFVGVSTFAVQRRFVFGPARRAEGLPHPSSEPESRNDSLTA